MRNAIPLKAKCALVIAVGLWGSAYVGIRAGLQGYSPGGLALLRFLIASVFMWLIYVWRSPHSPIVRKDLCLILFTGVLGIGIYSIALNYGEVVVPSGMASFIVSQSPVVTALLAVIFLGERMDWLGWVGMLISIIGVALISLSKSNLQLYHGIFYVLIAMVVGSFYSVLQKSLLKKHHMLDVTSYTIWGGTVLLLIFLPNLMDDIKHASWNATFTAIYLGIFPAAIAYAAWSYILTEIPAARAVSFLYFMPVVATFIGWVWLHEIPTLVSFVGGIIALLGVGVVNYSYKIADYKYSVVPAKEE